jgi:predicted outer membrane repeat protein
MQEHTPEHIPGSRLPDAFGRAGRLLGALALAGALNAVAISSAAASALVRVPQNAPTLQAAVSAVSPGGTIEMSGGTYVAPSGGFVLNQLGKGFTVRAAAGQTVVLTGQGAHPVMRIQNTHISHATPITFREITFRDGRSTTDGLAGGVTLSHAIANFEDCTFTNNVSDAPHTGGGGVAVFEGSSALFLRTLFQGNTARNEGGALRVGGGSYAEVRESRFLGNRTNLAGHRSTAGGGAIHVGDSNALIVGTRFQGNQAGYAGGALYVIGSWGLPASQPRADVTVINSTFHDNVAANHPSVTPPTVPEGAL